MRDLDSDGRADRVVLRYSEPVRHRRDADERYPFSVDGYDISLVRAARETPWLVIEVKEKVDPDPSARPVVRYRHTRRGAVRDLSAYQAVEQTISDVLPLSFVVAVTTGGSGSGTVVSTPEGIDCGTYCSGLFRPGVPLTLTALPSPDSTFEGWAGACAGSARDCEVAPNGDVLLTATFSAADPGGGGTEGGSGTGGTGGGGTGGGGSTSGGGGGSGGGETGGGSTGGGSTGGGGTGGNTGGGGGGSAPQAFALAVTKDGTGSGTVSSAPAGIDCGADCSESYISGTVVTLTATATAGSVFSGWSGACMGSSSACAVTMDAARAVTATFALQTFALTVTKAGAGAGTVSSAPAGIDCGGDCSESYTSGTVVMLTATATAGSVFSGWSGACTGSSSTCSVTMDAARSVTATFDPQTFTLAVTKDGTGAGTVSSAPAGIDCGADCSESYISGTVVTLTATATTGSVFSGWSGACTGSSSTCSVTMDAARSVTATFAPQAFALAVSKAGTGSGTVTSVPAGISCGADCSESYAPSTTVTLTAVAALGSVFTGWSGDCAGALATCVLTMDAAKNVTATFNLL